MIVPRRHRDPRELAATAEAIARARCNPSSSFAQLPLEDRVAAILRDPHGRRRDRGAARAA